MNYNSAKNRKGFTLIELVVYLALVSGILVTATSFAWNIINSRTKAFAVQEVAQNGRFISERLVQVVHQAMKIVEPQPGESSERLLLTMRESADDPTKFIFSDGRLFMARGDGEPLVMNSDQVFVKSLRFVNLSPSNAKSQNLKIIIELEHVNPENRQEWRAAEIFTTAVELRDNY